MLKFLYFNIVSLHFMIYFLDLDSSDHGDYDTLLYTVIERLQYLWSFIHHHGMYLRLMKPYRLNLTPKILPTFEID